MFRSKRIFTPAQTRITPLVMLLLAALWLTAGSASVALQAQEESTSPKAGTQQEAASSAVADKSSQPSPATPSKELDQGETFAPGWMDRLLQSSEEVQHVDAPGTPPHEHPGAAPAAPHQMAPGATMSAAESASHEHGVVTADV